MHFSESITTCADEIATVASNTFIFGSKTSLNGIPVSNSRPKNNKPNTTVTAKLENKRRCNGEFQNDRKKNEGQNKNRVPNNKVTSPTVVPISSSSSSYGGSVLSQATKPWFIATRNQSSLDEMKELNLEMWNERSGSNHQLDKDVLY